jgi:hypothetical protein
MTSFKGAEESAPSQEVSATPGATGEISGSVRYADKEYGPSGFTGTLLWKDVRYATVDIVDNNNPTSVLYSTTTDSRGKYWITTVPSSTVVYVRVNSVATPPSAGSVRVKNLGNNIYGVPSDPFPLSGSANVNLSIPTTNDADGAFNILDVFVTGYDFVKAFDGAYPSVDLSAFWSPTNYAGTYYCTGCSAGDGIYVYSYPSGDTDQFDDDVLWHEFGHFLASTYSLDESMGGYHTLADNDHDLRFSWSEGWGNYIPGAIKSWLKETDPDRLSIPSGQSTTLYTDTSGNSGWSFDFGTAPLVSAYSYASGEVAVANILLRLRASFTTQDVWDVTTSFLTSPPTTPVNLELFWDRWLASKPTSSGGVTVGSLFEDRLVLYRDDPFEQDDSLATAATITVGIMQTNRTLYPESDGDYAHFLPEAGKSYTVRTSSLRNGADTYLEVYNDADVLIYWNDNDSPAYSCNIYTEICHENGNDVLSSTVNIPTVPTAPSKPYTIRVYSPMYLYSSTSKPLSAGRYGTYNLSVTSP